MYFLTAEARAFRDTDRKLITGSLYLNFSASGDRVGRPVLRKNNDFTVSQTIIRKPYSRFVHIISTAVSYILIY